MGKLIKGKWNSNKVDRNKINPFLEKRDVQIPMGEKWNWIGRSRLVLPEAEHKVLIGYE